jgi:hypothetical protein
MADYPLAGTPLLLPTQMHQHALPPMTPKRHSATPHRQRRGSGAAAGRQRGGSGTAAARQGRCSKLHCTKPAVDSDLSKAASRRSSAMALRLTHGAAPGWAYNREKMGERRTDAERPGGPTASHD